MEPEGPGNLTRWTVHQPPLYLQAVGHPLPHTSVSLSPSALPPLNAFCQFLGWLFHKVLKFSSVLAVCGRSTLLCVPELGLRGHGDDDAARFSEVHCVAFTGFSSQAEAQSHRTPPSLGAFESGFMKLRR